MNPLENAFHAYNMNYPPMSPDFIRRLVKMYRNRIARFPAGITSPDGLSSTVRLPVSQENYQPAGWPDLFVWMCDRILNGFLPAGDTDNAILWLGFMQGMLYLSLTYTIEELRKHRSTDFKFPVDLESKIK